MAERIGEWRDPAYKLPPILQEVPLWINGRHVVGYYNGIAWFGRKGILPHAPSRWFERRATDGEPQRVAGADPQGKGGEG